MKKMKQPGENISLKMKKTESAAIVDWINSQTNLMDSIRFLIENEIQQNGIRNLQHFIPADRNIPVRTSLPVPENEGAADADSSHKAAVVLDVQALTSPHANANGKETTPADQKKIESTREKPPEEEIDDEDVESWT